MKIMKGIKSKILISFCIAVAATIAVIVMAVSWRLDRGFSQQSKLLVDYMTARTHKVVDSYNQILESFIGNVKEDMRRITKDLCANPAVIKNIESQHLEALTNLIQKYSETSGADFIMVFDLVGRHQASFPRGVDGGKAEEYYTSWALGARILDVLKGSIKDDEVQLGCVSRHDSDFLKAFGLSDRDVSGKGAISIACAGVIRDDFGDPIGACITGKLLNQYHSPLRQLYEATGSACVLYLDNIPLAYAGFKHKDGVRFNDSTLRISPDNQKKVYQADKSINVSLTLAGGKYIGTCSALKSYNGEKIGIICTVLPEQNIIEAQGVMFSYGDDTKKGIQAGIQAWIILIGVVSLTIFIIVSFIIARGIIRPINRAIEGLNESTDQVASASSQISSSSQSLAEGASEQAASLEETSSSLEEMASMTKQNADNATQADTLMKEANRTVEKATTSMGELTTSMEEISKASEETQKIIKTIDEIAFQTNLLALNAAVEAARAGEAGAGFAVVANEVRNLAMRAADAAKNTSGFIEGTVTKVKDGSDLVTTANEAFAEVSQSASKVGELVGEIAAASQEQASGIEQVNKAVAEIDKVTQQTAANAEETASASEEMNAQAAQMKGIVGELTAIVGGNRGRAEKTTMKKADAEIHNAFASPGKKVRVKEGAIYNQKEVKSNQAIPMDDADFKEF